MPSSGASGGIGSTLTGGIQDIAVILPLLGTEQFHVRSKSAQHLHDDIFTRLQHLCLSLEVSGMVSAGLKTLVACFSLGDIEGAKILGNMGFELQGANLSLIMVKAGKGKNIRCYIFEHQENNTLLKFT